MLTEPFQAFESICQYWLALHVAWKGQYEKGVHIFTNCTLPGLSLPGRADLFLGAGRVNGYGDSTRALLTTETSMVCL